LIFTGRIASNTLHAATLYAQFQQAKGVTIMSVARVTEIIASSPQSFEDAVEKGMQRAAKTLKNVRSGWVEGQKVFCDDNGNIKEFRVNLKVTFVLND
jgi:dodecin